MDRAIEYVFVLCKTERAQLCAWPSPWHSVEIERRRCFHVLRLNIQNKDWQDAYNSQNSIFAKMLTEVEKRKSDTDNATAQGFLDSCPGSPGKDPAFKQMIVVYQAAVDKLA